jgi:NAD+ diphosphatase
MTQGRSIDIRHITPQLSLDRAGEKRRDRVWCDAQLRSPRARFYLLIDLSPAIISDADGQNTKLRALSSVEVHDLGLDVSNACFLGLEADATPVFSFGISMADAIAAFRGEAGLPVLIDVRSLARQTDISGADLTLAAQARSLATWHDTHRCCGRCGARTRLCDAGWRRECWACGQNHFPRFDPAVIMLIEWDGKCLLGNEPRFAENMYSVLAGFVEPGDDIENAVRREIMEEVGIRVGRVRYIASQPWPFPHSLMIGCWGEALNGDITPDPEEINDARWFDRETVHKMMAGEHPEGLFVPPPLSISHTLIRAFADGTLG